MALGPGVRFGPYEILQPIGAGGMGEVHRARHVKLRRDVAIKVLPPALARDPSRLARFEREARTASALNHPNIITIHDIGEHEGTTYIAMELVAGRTLREVIAEGPIPIAAAVGWAGQIADGLARAHAADIVHRDIKPANVMVTGDGLVKILDFGLAKPLATEQGRDIAGSTVTETQEGLIVGTPHYMSPEQCAGDPLDHRSDQFALGTLLYEMVGGKVPFDGPSGRAIMSAILVSEPPPLRRLRPDVPADLDRIILRCLEKDPAQRFGTTAELAAALHRTAQRQGALPRRIAAVARRPAGMAAIVAVLLAVVASGWAWSRGAGKRWAGGPALEEIARLTERGNVYQAYRTALRAAEFRPGDPVVQRLLERMTLPIAVNTEPPGAEVSVKDYATPEARWEALGTTPMTPRIPYAMMRWRITRAGYEPFEGAPFSGPAIGVLAQGLTLDTLGSLPPGMVRIPGGVVAALPGSRPSGEIPAAALQSFFLDRFEVTNRQYREFIDAGGYQKAEWWPSPIEQDGRAVPWQDAMGLFVDPTGRAGPSTWEAGSYPAAESDHPVGGISWYEAAAFCASRGRSLPTVYHWFHAIGQDQLSDILTHSNMGGDAKAPVGRYQGLGGYGTYDMAGNVKEWVWNAAGRSRYILGGAWNEPTYLFKHLIAQPPMDRAAVNGVRCAAYPEGPGPELTAPVTPDRQYTRPTPLTDDTWAVLRGLYTYDRSPLEPRIERVNDSLPDYRRETISIRTAYGSERMEVHLLMPRNASPPYQSVIWFPGDDVFLLQSSETFSSTYLFDFVPKSGRVLVHPVYHGMFERFEPPEYTPSALRDRMIRWSQDLARTIDYIETRPDFDAGKIAYYGFSAGAVYAPVFTAIEPRLAASILLGGGLVPAPFRPESDPAAFAPRSRTPTLMINGRDDFLLPYELSQQPLLAMLGAPDNRKRQARLEGGHIPRHRVEIIREVLAWLDEQLGPVQRTEPGIRR